MIFSLTWNILNLWRHLFHVFLLFSASKKKKLSSCKKKRHLRKTTQDVDFCMKTKCRHFDRWSKSYDCWEKKHINASARRASHHTNDKEKKRTSWRWVWMEEFFFLSKHTANILSAFWSKKRFYFEFKFWSCWNIAKLCWND